MNKNEESEDVKKTNSLNWNLIILGVILLIAVVSIAKLILWNIGTKSDFDPNFTTTDFDIEALDTIIPLDPDNLVGRVDDNITTILCIGNNPLSDETGKKGIASLIATQTGGTVYNAAFPDSRVGAKFSSLQSDYTRDLFNLPYVAKSIAEKDFSALLAAASVEEDSRYALSAKVLEELDYEKLDAIIIMYDAIDYIEKTPADNPNDPYELSTFTGGLRNAFESIQNTYPYIRIYYMSHSFCHSLDENGNFQSGGSIDLGNGTLSHYLLKGVDVAIDCGISVIDNYYGTINETNYADYLSDNIHLNDAGRKLMADRISQILITGQSSMK